ncbi:MAG: FAD-dependent oxidoreductase, partial [Brevibacterium aurantiacum]|nr:FAD-dependent oxidoreductase [Brevibacterium aurantiacum]
MSISRVAVVGAGIVGVALAREITSRFPDAEVTVFDKAERVAAHQSGHTSGVVDPALAAQPGSPEAKLAHRGVELLVPFVSERGIPYRECGQLLVAQNTDEADRLEEILARAEANSIPGVRLLDRKEMREIEPNARGVLALYAPHTAVTDFTALTEALASDVSAAGGTFRLSTEVTGFDVMSNEVRLRMRAAAPEQSEPPVGTEGSDGDSASGADRDIDSGSDGEIDDQQKVHRILRPAGVLDARQVAHPQLAAGRDARDDQLGEREQSEQGDSDPPDGARSTLSPGDAERKQPQQEEDPVLAGQARARHVLSEATDPAPEQDEQRIGRRKHREEWGKTRSQQHQR